MATLRFGRKSPGYRVAGALLVGLLAAATLPARADQQELSVRDVVVALRDARPGTPVNFAGRNLQSLDLSNLDFKSAKLDSSNLFGTDLTDSNLRGAKLQKSILNRATLTRTNFRRADLSGATLLRPTIHTTLEPAPSEAPVFREALLRKVQFQGRFDGTDFGASDMTGAIFGERSTLVRCEFSGSELQSAQFDWTNLTYARFQASRLKGARFQNAKLIWVDFTDADLRNADFKGADVSLADFTGADVRGANFEGTEGLDSAKGLKR